MKYIFGNWKSNKNITEARSWLRDFTSRNLDVFEGKLTIVLCPPYPFLPLVKDAFEDYDYVHAGAQDISQFGAGKYTGAVAAHTLSGLVDFVIVGHSERRKHFNESLGTVDQKAQNAISSGITPIVCVRNEKDIVPDGVQFVAYEPIEAIGSGENASIQDVEAMKKKIQMPDGTHYIYGGSVAPHNVREYMKHPEIDGVLPGTASLDPETFYDLALNSL